ncbi:MAG: HAD-IA family hydrolase [Gordonia sp. (in: high G+C Gram-positive bacteria)]|uniref:HAD-IA family hydrolase n=1 Tax=Gordonia sp. (in: high G+C Gram-positive bacteria) TaxID=84139 RepID=UPI003BB7ABE2
MTTTYDAAAILLDMDGTLVDSTPVVERDWTAWASQHGVDPQAVLDFCHGRQGYVTMAQFLPDRPHEINLAENRELLRAEDVERSKPDPEGFLAAAALLGVQPTDCLVFEDSAAGIAAARAAGMQVIGGGSADAAATADLHLPDYLDVVVEQTPGGVRLTFP